MNAIMMSAVTALGLVGFFGSAATALSDVKKAMAECCATKTADCCSTKADNCCTKKMEGCCEKKMKDECCTWSTSSDGKRTFRKRHCVQEMKSGLPGTVRIEVKSEDRQPGDIEGFKTVGKNTVKVYYRDVERKPESVVDSNCSSKDGCNYAYFTQGKRIERRSFCTHDNQQVMCGEKASECSSCLK